MKNEQFEEPKMETVRFDTDDIIVTSGSDDQYSMFEGLLDT